MARGARECYCCASTVDPDSEANGVISGVEISGQSAFVELQAGLSTDDPGRRPSIGGEKSIVQFTCALYYVKEGEEESMSVDVVRLGHAEEEATVYYETKDGSALANVKYKPCRGYLSFKAGESLKSIQIPILENDSWDAVLEFGVELKNGLNCQLGKYLKSCRVVVIDDDFFPSNQYAEEFKAEDYESIPPLGLYIEFVKFLWSNPIIRCDMVKHMLYGLICGFGYFITMYLQVYLIDVVLAAPEKEEGAEAEEAPEKGEGGEKAHESHEVERRLARAGVKMFRRYLEEKEGGEGGEEEEEEEEAELGFMLHELIVPGSRQKTAIFVALFYLVPYLINHVSSYRMVYIGLKAKVRKLLQANLLRKYLYYDEVRRLAMKPEAIGMTMMRDTFEVVDVGLMKLLTLFAIFCKLSFALIFILAENRLAAVPLVACGVVLPMFLKLREKQTIESVDERCEKQDVLLEGVNFAARSYRLIADFFMRPVVISHYESEIDVFVEADERSEAIFMNNMAIAPWMTGLIIGGYMIYGSEQVSTVGGTLRLGIFLATINIFKEVGAEIKEIYLECNEIQKCYAPLIQVAKYMNYHTDLDARKRVNRQRRKMGESERQRLREKLGSTVDWPVDYINIQFIKVSFGYRTAEKEYAQIFREISGSFEQGQLHAILGKSHVGKSTFLKLLGQVFIPDEPAPGDDLGSVFVPPHLRILHLSQDVFFFTESLLKNIILNNHLDEVGGIERVKGIMKDIGFREEILNHLRAEEDVNYDEEDELSENQMPKVDKSWQNLMSHTHFPKLSLARALIMNPEVLVMHKPMLGFNRGESLKVAQLLREHVDQKGLCLNEEERFFRRPRTVFFSSLVPEEDLGFADTIHRLEAETDGKQSILKIIQTARKQTDQLDGLWASQTDKLSITISNMQVTSSEFKGYVEKTKEDHDYKLNVKDQWYYANFVKGSDGEPDKLVWSDGDIWQLQAAAAKDTLL